MIQGSRLVVRIDPVPPPLKNSSATPRAASVSLIARRFAWTAGTERRLTSRFTGLSGDIARSDRATATTVVLQTRSV